MRILKNKAFHCWAKEVKLSDNKLKEAVNEISNGLYEAKEEVFLKSVLHWMVEEKVLECVL